MGRSRKMNEQNKKNLNALKAHRSNTMKFSKYNDQGPFG